MARGAAKHASLWPWLAVPLGLTLLLAAGAWLFWSKYEADRAALDAEHEELENYAADQAGDLARQASRMGTAWANEKIAARRQLEADAAQEAKGILDSVYRFVISVTDASHRKNTNRGRTEALPTGFDSMRTFLSIEERDDEADPFATALQSASVEIQSLLPPGCMLMVVEDYSRQVYVAGGAPIPPGSIVAAASKEYIFDDRGRNRVWTVRLEVAAPAPEPEPDMASTAQFLSGRMGAFRLNDASWQGWLVSGDGGIQQFGPDPEKRTDEAPPFVHTADQWLDAGARYVWMHKGAALADTDWTPVVAVAIDKPVPMPDISDALLTDIRWGSTLGILFVLCVGGWMLFWRSMHAAEPQMPARPQVQTSQRAQVMAAAQEVLAARKLVRDQSVRRAAPTEQSVIVADIDDNGTVRIEQPAAPAPRPAAKTEQQPARTEPQPPAPGGSLARLQALHRGSPDAPGSRILDHAHSRILRELAAHVRPRRRAAAQPLAARAGTAAVRT